MFFLLMLVLLLIVTTSISTSNANDKLLLDIDSISCTMNDAGIEPVGELHRSEAVIFTSSQSGLRLRKQLQKFTREVPKHLCSQTLHIEVDPEAQFQTIQGFGGALSDSAIHNLGLVDAGVRDAILRSYFGSDGARYTLARISIASCDSSLASYSYNDHVADYEMKHFSIDVDGAKKLPLIRNIISFEPKLQLLVSSWSAPDWMKTGLSRRILKNNAQTWAAYATYISKFITSYRSEGIKIWAIAVENEPTKLPLFPRSWHPMYFDSHHARKFIANHLGPILHRLHPDLKLFINIDPTPNESTDRVQEIVGGNSPARKYVSGVRISSSWVRSKSVEGPFPLFQDVAEMTNTYSNFLFINSDLSNYVLPWERRLYISSWERAQRLAHAIIRDLNAGAHGWMDWSIVLDVNGGPNWANNSADAPIMIDPELPDRFYKQPSWFILAHISRFVRPGSVRLSCDTLSTTFLIEVSCFRTPESKIVILLLNRDRHDVPVSVQVPSKGRLEQLFVEKRSIMTVIFDMN